MLLDLSSEQEVFVDTTRRYLQSRCPPATLRAARSDPAGFDPEYWAQGAELGWTSLAVSEADGGGSVSGQGVVDLSLIAEEFGRHASPGPLLPVNVVAAAISRWGSAGQKRTYLPGLLAGEFAAGWALAEPPPHDRLGSVTCTATPAGDGYVLSGIKAPVEAGGQAACLLVTATTGDGLLHCLVPTTAPGVTVEALHSLDVTRRYAQVRLEDVEIPASAVVGEPGAGARYTEELLQLALVIQLAEVAGAMDRCLALAIEWAFDRYSFGRPLASYQELKHRFADMRTWLEAAHGLVEDAVAHVQSGSERAAEFVSAAKAYLGQYGPDLAQDCVQIHGGIGMTFDHDLHLYLRRVVIGSQLFGTVAEHRQRLTTLISRSEDAS